MHERGLGVGRFGDFEFPPVEDEPRPPGPKLGRARRGKVLLERVVAAQVAVDGGGEGARGLGWKGRGEKGVSVVVVLTPP